MADKSFGVKEINLIGASGTPTIESPNNLNINATNVAISTDMSIGGELTVTDTFLKPHAVGLGTTNAAGRDAGISTATGTVIYIPDVGMQVYSGITGWKTISNTSQTPPGSFIEETTFPHTPLAAQPYPIPSSAESLDIYVFGAGGGGNDASGTGGGGGFAQMTIPVPSLSNSTLTVVVGEGGPAPGNSAGADPDGAFGGGGNVPAATGVSGGGGGYSGVFDGPVSQGNAIIIAGGGGGGGYPGTHGGQGGGTTGGTGTGNPSSSGGGGGTQSAGGAAGTPTVTNTAGSALKGGSGPSPSTNAGSGGGGYYGGGGGSLTSTDGGGGGGSGYVSPNAVTSARVTPANNGGSNGPAPASAGAPSPFYSPPIGFGRNDSAARGGPGYVVIRSYT